ncbi:hypothetical protein F2P79_007229, partial [Pimephales promelas]
RPANRGHNMSFTAPVVTYGESAYGLLGYYRRNMPPATARQQFPNDKYLLYRIITMATHIPTPAEHMRRAGKMSSL